MKPSWWARLAPLSLLAACTWAWLVQGCGPGPGHGIRTKPRKLTPMSYKQFVPNFSENNLGASGRAEGKITRNSERFNELVCNYNTDIDFKDEENTRADRFMTKRCKDCLNKLAIAVMNQWPGVRLRVTEAWDEDGHHPPNSLHYEGRAVDITTSDRDSHKYGLLAQMAVEAGFDWVHYESKYHVHCSVKADHSVAVEKGGCFPGWAQVIVAGQGQKDLSSLAPGDRVMTLSESGQAAFSRVLSFLHRDSRSRSTFLVLCTEHSRCLTLTPHHLVFLSPHYERNHSEYPALFASRAKLGDFVLVYEAGGVQPSKIISVSVVEGVGVYAPLTEHGTLFVDGVLASSYAVVEDHRLAHWGFGPLRLLLYFSQLVWVEKPPGGKTTESKNTYWGRQALNCVHAKKDRLSCNSNLTVSLSKDVVRNCDTAQAEVSNVHWYARLLHSLGRMCLNTKSFHL